MFSSGDFWKLNAKPDKIGWYAVLYRVEEYGNVPGAAYWDGTTWDITEEIIAIGETRSPYDEAQAIAYEHDTES